MQTPPAPNLAGFSVSPFKVTGSKSVVLETIKRGEDDDFSTSAKGSTRTVILRMYEAKGGKAVVKLQM